MAQHVIDTWSNFNIIALESPVAGERFCLCFVSAIFHFCYLVVFPGWWSLSTNQWSEVKDRVVGWVQFLYNFQWGWYMAVYLLNPMTNDASKNSWVAIASSWFKVYIASWSVLIWFVVCTGFVGVGFHQIWAQDQSCNARIQAQNTQVKRALKILVAFCWVFFVGVNSNSHYNTQENLHTNLTHCKNSSAV
jgi:hypothetical protein